MPDDNPSLPDLDKNMSDSARLQAVAIHMSYMSRDMRDLKKQVSSNLITRAEFTPVRNLVYGMVGLILTSFVLAVIGLVFVK